MSWLRRYRRRLRAASRAALAAWRGEPARLFLFPLTDGGYEQYRELVVSTLLTPENLAEAKDSEGVRQVIADLIGARVKEALR